MKTMAEAFELTAQFRVVINFTVEDQDGIAVIAQHRLRAVLEINDFQAHRAKRYLRRLPNPLLVRPAVRDRPRDLLNPRRIRNGSGVSESGYPAHLCVEDSTTG
jgi:hypothetical protein